MFKERTGEAVQVEVKRADLARGVYLLHLNTTSQRAHQRLVLE